MSGSGGVNRRNFPQLPEHLREPHLARNYAYSFENLKQDSPNVQAPHHPRQTDWQDWDRQNSLLKPTKVGTPADAVELEDRSSMREAETMVPNLLRLVETERERRKLSHAENARLEEVVNRLNNADALLLAMKTQADGWVYENAQDGAVADLERCMRMLEKWVRSKDGFSALREPSSVDLKLPNVDESKLLHAKNFLDTTYPEISRSPDCHIVSALLSRNTILESELPDIEQLERAIQEARSKVCLPEHRNGSLRREYDKLFTNIQNLGNLIYDRCKNTAFESAMEALHKLQENLWEYYPRAIEYNPDPPQCPNRYKVLPTLVYDSQQLMARAADEYQGMREFFLGKMLVLLFTVGNAGNDEWAGANEQAGRLLSGLMGINAWHPADHRTLESYEEQVITACDIIWSMVMFMEKEKRLETVHWLAEKKRRSSVFSGLIRR
ncbi:hypothetical protein T439DRAFT_352273 [Meredithblackwellia eburnea MCA 4105]